MREDRGPSNPRLRAIGPTQLAYSVKDDAREVLITTFAVAADQLATRFHEKAWEGFEEKVSVAPEFDQEVEFSRELWVEGPANPETGFTRYPALELRTYHAGTGTWRHERVLHVGNRVYTLSVKRKDRDPADYGQLSGSFALLRPPDARSVSKLPPGWHVHTFREGGFRVALPGPLEKVSTGTGDGQGMVYEVRTAAEVTRVSVLPLSPRPVSLEDAERAIQERFRLVTRDDADETLEIERDGYWPIDVVGPPAPGERCRGMDYGVIHDTLAGTWTRSRAYVAAGSLFFVEVVRDSRERVDEDYRHVAHAFQLVAR